MELLDGTFRNDRWNFQEWQVELLAGQEQGDFFILKTPLGRNDRRLVTRVVKCDNLDVSRSKMHAHVRKQHTSSYSCCKVWQYSTHRD